MLVRYLSSAGALASALAFSGCASDAASAAGVTPDAAPTSDAVADSAAATDGGSDAAGDSGAGLAATITADFRDWLAANGYGDDDFAREGSGGSFGGRAVAGESIAKIPVVFVHGNSDAAIGRDETFTGWDASRRAFADKGWTEASLYGTTWGPADASLAYKQAHSKVYLGRVRRFLQAVAAYTGASKIAVVAHSMGVTLTRKAIEGGAAEDPTAGGAYDLGPRLAFVETFVGIAGANLGLDSCRGATAFPTCSKVNGFYPGVTADEGPSKLLAAMNATPHDEADHVFAIWSSTDSVVGASPFGKPTCPIPGQDAEIRRDALDHFGLKDQTTEDVWKLVTTHAP